MDQPNNTIAICIYTCFFYAYASVFCSCFLPSEWPTNKKVAFSCFWGIFVPIVVLKLIVYLVFELLKGVWENLKDVFKW